MGRQVELERHCLLCLKETSTPQQSYGAGNARVVYIRNDGGISGMQRLASICHECLGIVRGGNWPADVYAKLTADRRAVEGERAAEAILAS